MSRSKRSGRSWKVALAVVTSGMVLALIPSCQGILTTFNPGGSVFGFVQDYQIDALFGSVPDFSLDPSCTIPYFGVQNSGLAGTCATSVIYDQTPGPRPQGQP